MKEKITIIVPVYNVEKYLRECIDSIINQTYKNIEIILVDDGSKDKSGAVCDEYAAIDSRIKVIHKKNEGLGFARNSGLEITDGEYVTFIDSDDKADSDLIQSLVDCVKDSACDTCIGGFKRITEDGEVTFKENYGNKLFTGSDVYNNLFARMLGSSPEKHDAIKMSVWNVLYSVKIIKENNLRFPSEREFISEDIIWNSEYFKYSQKAMLTDSTAYNYRITPSSLTQKYKPDMLGKICVLYNELCRRVLWEEEKVLRIQRQFFVNLRVCIKQENAQSSKKSPNEIKESLKTILNNETVKNVSKNYLKFIKQKKQKLFVMLVAYKQINLLYFMLKNNIF